MFPLWCRWMYRKGAFTLYNAHIHVLISPCYGFCILTVTEEDEEEKDSLRFLNIFKDLTAVLIEQAQPMTTCCTFREERTTLRRGVVTSSLLCLREKGYWCQSALWLVGVMVVIKEEKFEGARKTSEVMTPPEGRWGWMIVASCFLATICIRAVTRWFVCVSICLCEVKSIQNVLNLMV